MTSHKSVLGFWGAEPHTAPRRDWGWHGDLPQGPLTLWVWEGLGGSRGFPTLPLQPKPFSISKLGVKAIKGLGEGGRAGAQFCLLSESNILVQSPVSSLGTLSTPQKAFWGGTAKESNQLLKKRGDSPQSHARASWGCQHRVTGCPRAGTGARWQ